MSRMTRATTTAGLMMAILAAHAAAEAPKHTTDGLDKVKERVEAKKAVLVDVREKREWDKGHVEGAVFLPLSQLTAWERDGIGAEEKAKLAELLSRGPTVYLHCAAGGRSLVAGEVLGKLGFQTRPLKPGYRELIEAGFAPAKSD